MGPLMLDCQAEELTQEEREILAHPVTGGVILFSRNYYDRAQLKALTKSIREAAGKPILIATDHEGGRVQRFRDGFTRLPAMGSLRDLAKGQETAESLANACGLVIGAELRAIDIDFSFAPVLDVDGISAVIGDRGFAETPEDVITLAQALIDGMHAANMPVTGKHFPGHGSVAPDSHVALPVDEREEIEIMHYDMRVFSELIKKGKLDAIMPAHVIYNKVDDKPAGFSPYWLKEILRKRLGFDGVIFSDDLSMHGASVAGNYPQRAEMALEAGCDMILACNNPKGAIEILDALPHTQTNTRLPALLRPQPTGHEKDYNRAKSIIEAVQRE